MKTNKITWCNRSLQQLNTLNGSSRPRKLQKKRRNKIHTQGKTLQKWIRFCRACSKNKKKRNKMCAPLKVKSKKLTEMRVRKTIEIERVKMPPLPPAQHGVFGESSLCKYSVPPVTPNLQKWAFAVAFLTRY